MPILSNGPFLSAALICEKVLQEKDDAVSIIRVVDRVTLTVPAINAPEKLPPTPINVYVFISLKSGSAKGSHTLKLRVEAPSGLRQPEQLLPVLLEGEDRGANLIVALNMFVDQEGLYWFDIFFEEQMLTRIPLRILYQRVGQIG